MENKMMRYLATAFMLTLTITATNCLKCVRYNNKKSIACTAGSSDYTLRKGLFSNNNVTNIISLASCRIANVTSGAFENDDNLDYIDLAGNKISSIVLGVFTGCRKITDINLSYNMLTTLPQELFNETVNIQKLDLSGNKLNRLEIGLFDPLVNLKTLDLSCNDLKGSEFDSYTFSKCKGIHSLKFTSNNMSGSPDNLLEGLSSLHKLNLDSCSLAEVPSFVTGHNLTNLNLLVLCHNEITKIEDTKTFAGFDNLETLNLAGNVITNIANGVFTPLKNLKSLMLADNNLEVLPEGLFHDMPSLSLLYLSGNNLEYIPVNAFEGIVNLKQLDLSFNRFTYLESNFFSQLRNSGLYLKKLVFDYNPWQCACLNDILNEAKKYNIDYNRNRYTGDAPVCVTMNNFTCLRQSSHNKAFTELYDHEIKDSRPLRNVIKASQKNRCSYNKVLLKKNDIYNHRSLDVFYTN